MNAVTTGSGPTRADKQSRGQTYSDIFGRVMGNTGEMCLTLVIKYNKRTGDNLDSSVISTFKRWGKQRLGIQGHSPLCSEFKATLAYLNSCLPNQTGAQQAKNL